MRITIWNLVFLKRASRMSSWFLEKVVLSLRCFREFPDEWKTEWMHACTGGWMNACMHRWVNRGMHAQIGEWMHACTGGWINSYMHRWVNECINAGKAKMNVGWMGEWMHEWLSGQMSFDGWMHGFKVKK